MELLTGKQAAARVAGILNAKYQVHAYWVDLTIRGISGVQPTGKLDFGGGEYVAAGHTTIAPQRLRPEDNYQWWELERGCYIIEFNEALEPDPRTIRTGATHVSVFLRGHVAQMDTLFDVQALRLSVKQNARVSRLRVFRLGVNGEADPLMHAATNDSEKTQRRPARK
jgi:hypothetical protein